MGVYSAEAYETTPSRLRDVESTPPVGCEPDSVDEPNRDTSRGA